jgi:hypothetical protein
MLRRLDANVWQTFQARAGRHVSRRDKRRGFQQVFDAFGEGLAYGHLLDLACKTVRFIPEAESETPDLEGAIGNQRVLCEAKTINISDEEIAYRRHPGVVRKVSDVLPSAFFDKLDSVVSKAKGQLKAFDPNREARWLVYINVRFDDERNRGDYCKQISWHCGCHHRDVELVFGPPGF